MTDRYDNVFYIHKPTFYSSLVGEWTVRGRERYSKKLTKNVQTDLTI